MTVAMNTPVNAIEIKGLKKSYKDFTLGSFDLTLPSGTIMGLVGENGAGKSTTINLIMNTVKRDAGYIKVLGCDNATPGFTSVKEDIGVVLDEAYFPEMLTPANVNSIMKNTYKNWDEKYYNGFLSRFGLPSKKLFKDFSRGMKMKLAIAVALSHSPRLLILDEATSGLDPIVRDEILDVFNDFTRQENHSVLLSSHIVSDLEKICDYIAFIHKGKLVLCDEKDALLERYAIIRVTRDAFSSVPPEAVIGKKENSYGVEALVLKNSVSSAFRPEYTTLEDIIVFIAKGDEKR